MPTTKEILESIRAQKVTPRPEEIEPIEKPLTPTEKYLYEELKLPRTELRAAPPDESIIKLPELEEERKTIGKEAFKEKYLYKPTSSADEEMVKMIRSKELVSFVEKEISNEEK